MIKRFSIASAILTVLAAVLASMLVVAVPAFAGPKGDGGSQDSKQVERGDHDGDADSDPGTTVDESDEDESTADEDDNQHPSGKDRSIENSPDGNPNQGKAESNPDDSKGPRRSEGVAGEDDKPNAGGGEDSADQDGNNGCGNDDDFDDDNNGWCGKPTKSNTTTENPCDKDNDMSNGVQKCEDSKTKTKTRTKPCDADKTMPGIQKCEKDEVKSGLEDKPCDKDDNMANGVQECDEDDDVVLSGFEAKPLPDAPIVLGTRLSRPAAPRAAVAPRVVRGQRVEGGVLPFTGSQPLSLMLIGLGILFSGAITVVATRK